MRIDWSGTATAFFQGMFASVLLFFFKRLLSGGPFFFSLHHDFGIASRDSLATVLFQR